MEIYWMVMPISGEPLVLSTQIKIEPKLETLIVKAIIKKLIKRLTKA